MTDRTRRAFLTGPAAPGDRVSLDPEESHHAARVLRLSRGDELRVFDGAGHEWNATIDDIARDTVTVVVGTELAGAVEAPIRVVIFQSNVRPEKLEWVLQKGTEIGVAAFQLVAAERAEAPEASPARLARYRRIVMEACKQSGRRTVPGLDSGEIPAAAPGVAALVLTQLAGAAPIGGLLRAPRPAEVWIAVGPEGGFSEAEVSSLIARGWKAASLGPRTLRTETAGAVASAVVLHVWGDLGPV